MSTIIDATSPVDRVSATISLEDQLSRQLREILLEELCAKGFDSPNRLAEATGMLTVKTEALLQRRESWSADTCLWLVERLDLPLSLQIERVPEPVRNLRTTNGSR